jgi:hypothetical protein
MTNPKLEVLTAQNSQIIFIDHQPQMAFALEQNRALPHLRDMSGCGFNASFGETT